MSESKEKNAMEITLKLDQWDIQSELTFVVEREKFTDEKAKEINEFWFHSEDRLSKAGSHFKAALMLYAAECFQLIAFNNFKDESWLTDQFDWNKKKGVEGFYSFDEIGLTLKNIENWHVEFDFVEICKSSEEI